MNFKYIAILILFIAIGLAIRFFIASMGIHGTDILFHIAGVRSLLETGSPYCNTIYTYPPLYSVIQLVGIVLFGWNVFGYKAMAILFDISIALLLYLYILRARGDVKTSLAISILWILNPLAIVTSSWYGLFDSIPTLFSILSIYYLQNLYVSTIALSLGITTKIFPSIIIPQILYNIYRRCGGVRRVIIYIAMVMVMTVLIMVMFIYRCPLNAIQQILFHMIREDRGLSIIPNIGYIGLVSIAIAMVIGLLTSIYNRSLEESIYISLTLINIFNSFIYPHYIIWFMPWLYISLSIRVREKSIAIASIATIAYTAIALSYWKFYRNINVVEILRALYYITTIILIIYIAIIISKKLNKNRYHNTL